MTRKISLDPNRPEPLSLGSARAGFLLNHTCVLKHVRPLAAAASMAMLQMLTEMISSVELLGKIALPEFVDLL